jgi:signal transduction histidine kinase
LLTNAIKYSPQGEKIWIEIQSLKNKLVVSVKDQGIGIDKNQQKRIFDRLYQVTDAKEKNFPGLGMGLYISREIIKRHRGAIWVEGEKGKGSTFYFSLPLN